MTLRTILVCLTSKHSAARLLDAAACLARRDNAHVIGLYVTESLMVYPGISVHIPEVSFKSILSSQKAHANEIKDIFEAQMKGETYPSEWRKLSSENGIVVDTIIASARSVDLIIMAQEDDDSDHAQPMDLQERVIKESGRPVLIIPEGFNASALGEKVVLGWSETREATRAAHDLLNVASPDAEIRVLRIGMPASNTLADHAANDMAVALARHGPSVEVVHRDKDSEQVAGILALEAFEMGADMLATGAFGHSRAYDFVIGAATRTLLHDAKLPVLFSK